MEGEAEMSNGITDASIMRMIKVDVVLGAGKTRDPVRVVMEYWTMAGELLVRLDPVSDLVASISSEEIHLNPVDGSIKEPL